MRRDLRSLRLALELMKPECGLRERGIKSTVVLFGRARIPAPEHAACAARNAVQKKNLKVAFCYYEEARQFVRLYLQYSATTRYSEFVIITGGRASWKQATAVRRECRGAEHRPQYCTAA